MLTFAQISNNAVVNISVWPLGSKPDSSHVDITNQPHVGIGWTTTDNINFSAPVFVPTPTNIPDPAVVATLTGLVAAGVITQAQMNTAVGAS